MNKKLLVVVFVVLIMPALFGSAIAINQDSQLHQPDATCVPGTPYYGIGECYITWITVVVTSTPTGTLPPATPDPYDITVTPMVGTPPAYFGPRTFLPVIVKSPIQPTPTWTTVCCWPTVTPTETPIP